MSYPINYPTPQGANVQIFRGGDAGAATIDNRHQATRNWVKPQGASFVWFTLIGAGGGGGGCAYNNTIPLLYYGGGGASGGVTNFMCPAFLLPDILEVAVGRGGNGGESFTNTDSPKGDDGDSTQIIYRQKDDTGYQLLYAPGGGGGGGGSISSAINGTAGSGSTGQPTPMTAAGFFNAVAGQAGVVGGSGTNNVNSVTFVNGGIGCSYNGPVLGYYGYASTSNQGYSQLSPTIMSLAGADSVGTTTVNQKASAFGSGGNGGGDLVNGIIKNSTRGGDGLAIIITW
jgi:hypothetical protein